MANNTDVEPEEPKKVASSVEPASDDKLIRRLIRRTQRKALEKKHNQKQAAGLSLKSEEPFTPRSYEDLSRKSQEPFTPRNYEEWLRVCYRPYGPPGYTLEHPKGTIVCSGESREIETLSFEDFHRKYTMRIAEDFYREYAKRGSEVSENRSATSSLASQARSSVALKRRSARWQRSKLNLNDLDSPRQSRKRL